MLAMFEHYCRGKFYFLGPRAPYSSKSEGPQIVVI